MEKQCIVQYVRDSKRQPLAVVVATDSDCLGVAIHNPKMPFNRDLLLQVAIGRANRSHVNRFQGVAYPLTVPSRSFVGYDNTNTDLATSIDEVVEIVRRRSEVYFKKS